MLPLNLVRWLFLMLLIVTILSKADNHSDDLLCLEKSSPSSHEYPEEFLPYSREPIAYSLSQAKGLLLDVWVFTGYLLSHCARYVFSDMDYSSLEEELNSHQHPRALFVLLQALDHPPEMWSQYLEALLSRTDIDIWIPTLPWWGNTSSRNVLKVLEKPLRQYLTQWPERPVILIGSSNGARIGLELEIQLRDLHSHIFLASIAGPFAGTRRIWMRSMITDAEFYQECSYDSVHNRFVMGKARERLAPETRRKHLFYVADGDFFIAPLNASLLALGHDEEYFYVKSAGHISIVNKVKEDVLEKAFSWIQQQQINFGHLK